MSINYTILGLLDCGKMSGYDLKKAIQDLPFFPWSGNNNQIYKILVELLAEDMVTNEVKHQDGSPSKKIYSITEKGHTALMEWVTSAEPEMPEFKKLFLVQLAWAGSIGLEKLNPILNQYEENIQAQIALHKEQKRRKQYFPDRNQQESFIWGMLCENIIFLYQAELEWIRVFKEGMQGIKDNE